jgi:preprotein translocase subunit SecA
MRQLERVIMLNVVDQKWMDHIDNMDQLRHGVYLRAYGQRDPVVEYRFEGFDMFEEMVNTIQTDTINILMHLRRDHMPEFRQEKLEMHENSPDAGIVTGSRKQSVKVGRNELCPCGSGKKYKKCCGA